MKYFFYPSIYLAPTTDAASLSSINASTDFNSGSFPTSETFRQKVKNDLKKVGSEVEEVSRVVLDGLVKASDTIEEISTDVLPIIAAFDPAVAPEIKTIESLISTTTSVVTTLDNATHATSVSEAVSDMTSAAEGITRMAEGTVQTQIATTVK